MEVKSKGIELSLSLEEGIALTILLGNMSRSTMVGYGVSVDEANLLCGMYNILSEFVPIRVDE